MIKSEERALNKKISETLLKLSRQANSKDIDFDVFLQQTLQTALKVLAADRVSLWHCNESQSQMHCVVSLEDNNSVESCLGELLDLRDHQNYFQALQARRVVSIENTQQDIQAKEFIASGYLKSSNVCAMLDMQIRYGDGQAAVICIEQIGEEREWYYQEQYFLGSVGELIGLAHSLSKGKELRKRLKQSEQQYRYLFEHNPSSLIIYDIDSLRLLEVNRACVEFLGYDRETLLNTTILQHLDSPDTDYLDKTLKAIDKRYELRTGPWLVQNKAGQQFIMEAHSHKIHFLNKSSRIVLLHDITQQEQARQELQDNLNALKNVRRAISNSFLTLITDVKGLVLEANDAFCQFFGYSLKELYKKPAPNLIFADNYPPDFWAKVEKSLEKSGFWAGELSLSSKPGEQHWLVVYLNAILNRKGELERVLALMYPIDERKKVELERDALIDRLIAQNQGLRTFTHLTSHHIRLPISRLLGLADLMDWDDKLSDEQKQVWNYIQQSIEELDTIVTDLNSVLEIRTEENFTEVDLSELFITSRHLLGSPLRKIKPQIQLQLNLLHVVSIRSFIENIFFQLLDNALKFRHPERQLEICISSFKTKDKYWNLRFEDNGLGIDTQRYEEDLFKMYQRFHPWVPGKGMGLFTVKRQVEMLNGRISLESELNEGTTIQISFPEEQPKEQTAV